MGPMPFGDSELAAQAALDPPPKSRHTPFPDWLPYLALWTVTGALAYRTAGPITDPDTWWHLRLGEEFRGAWSLADPGALTPFATRPWFATQWTLEVLASIVEQAFGLPGVAWLSGLGVVLLSIAVYTSCRQRSAVAAASIATVLCLLGTSLSLAPRPQTASFILTAVVTTAWLRTMNDLKARWWLVPLSWLWACTHGMWFVGVAIGVLVVVGLLLDHRLSRSAAVRLGLVPLASLLAAAVTPVGPKLVLAPFYTNKLAEYVAEWQAPDFSNMGVPTLVVLTLAGVVATWARGPARSWSEILLLAFAAGWVLLSYRTIAVGAVIAAPLVAGSIQSWLPADRLRVPRWESAVGIVASIAIVLGLALTTPQEGVLLWKSWTVLTRSSAHFLRGRWSTTSTHSVAGWNGRTAISLRQSTAWLTRTRSATSPPTRKRLVWIQAGSTS